MEAAAERTGEPAYLLVRVRGLLLALPVTEVAEHCRVPAVSGAGGARGLLGTALLRGEPVPLFDLGVLLGLPETAASQTPREMRRAVSLRLGKGVRAALVVDEVIGVRTLSAEAERAMPLPGGRIDRVGAFDREFGRLLEGSALLPDEAAPAGANG